MLFKKSIDLKILFKDELSSDVKFILHDRNGAEQTIPAHKAILKACSPVFEKMFYGDLKEGDSVKIIDVSAEAFNEYLQCLYLAEFELTAENVPEVLKLVDKYDTEILLPFCGQFLEQMVKPELLFMYYELAVLHKLKCEKLVKNIAQNFKDIVNISVDDGCNKLLLMNLLKSHQFACKEIVIFHGVIAWAETSLKKQNIAVTNENIEKEIDDLVEYIRFPTMSKMEFLSCIEKYPNMLPQKESIDILCFISLKRQLTVAQRFSTRIRVLDDICIEFEKYHTPYYARSDDFYFKMNITKNYLIEMWLSESNSIEVKCIISSVRLGVNSVVYDKNHSELNLDGCTSFILSEPINFEADQQYHINLVVSSRISAKFCLKPRLKQRELAKSYPFKSYFCGHIGSIISKIKFTEV